MSRVVLLHASRQAAVWLIFDVRQKMSVDYLKPTSRPVRILSCVGCVAATAICWLFIAVAIVGLRRANTSAADEKTAWFIIVFFGLLSSATTSIAYRLVRGRVAANRITTMPIWFIQAFGVFFLIGMLLVAFAERKWTVAIEGSSIAVAMILIGRAVAARKQKEPNKALEPTPTAVTSPAAQEPRQP